MKTLSQIDATAVKCYAREIFQIAQNHLFSGSVRMLAMRALINCGEAANEFVDEVVVLARGDGLYTGDSAYVLHMRVVAAEFIARHHRTTTAIEALIGLSASNEKVINMFAGTAYKDLVDDGVLDEKDLSAQQLKSLKKNLNLRN